MKKVKKNKGVCYHALKILELTLNFWLFKSVHKNEKNEFEVFCISWVVRYDLKDNVKPKCGKSWYRVTTKKD